MNGRRRLSPLHAIAALAMIGGLTPPPPPSPRGRRVELAGGPGEPNHVLEIPYGLTTRTEVIAFINSHAPRTGWSAKEGPTEEQISMNRVAEPPLGPPPGPLQRAIAQVDQEHRAQHGRDRMARAEAKRERKRRAREAR